MRFNTALKKDGRYGTSYHLKSVENKNIAGGLRGKVAATKTAWLLKKTKNSLDLYAGY